MTAALLLFNEPRVITCRHLDSKRRLWLALAVLAVCLKVLAPAGYMLAPPSEGSPFPLVLCTAQGLVAVTTDSPVDSGSEPAPADADTHDSPCAFAASPAAGLAPASGPWAPVAFFVPRAPRPLPQTNVAPSRSPAAPPPARAPPILLT